MLENDVRDGNDRDPDADQRELPRGIAGRWVTMQARYQIATAPESSRQSQGEADGVTPAGFFSGLPRRIEPQPPTEAA